MHWHRGKQAHVIHRRGLLWESAGFLSRAIESRVLLLLPLCPNQLVTRLREAHAHSFLRGRDYSADGKVSPLGWIKELVENLQAGCGLGLCPTDDRTAYPVGRLSAYSINGLHCSISFGLQGNQFWSEASG